MAINEQVNTLVKLNTYATNATMVVSINNVQEAGFKANMAVTPSILDYMQMDLNTREKVTRENNVNTVYVCFTEEVFNSVKEQGDIIPGLAGDLNMPKLDKPIMATTAGQAILTTMYHLSEGHNVTNRVNRLYLLEQVVDNNAQHLRHGFQMINIFNRGFATPQLQVPSGSSITFNAWERSRQIIWELQPLDGGDCRLRCVVGDVASGRSVIVFLRFRSSVSCCSPECLPVGGVSTVCVSSVSCGLVATELAFGSAIGIRTAGAVATGVQGYALIESKSCLSKLSGCTSLRIVRALTTRVAIPRMCSPVAASLPSHTPLKNLCSNFGIVLCVCAIYCTVSAKMQSGEACCLFHRL